MPTLERGDAERLLRFVAEAEDLASDQPFTAETLVELGRLVDADWITYGELDYVQRRFLLEVVRPGDDWSGGEEGPENVWDAIRENPICVRHREGYFGALKLSDFVALGELRRTRLYDSFLRPWGIQHRINVAIPSPLWDARSFSLDRRRGDFTERDRLVLDLLQPHLDRIWRGPGRGGCSRRRLPRSRTRTSRRRTRRPPRRLRWRRVLFAACAAPVARLLRRVQGAPRETRGRLGRARSAGPARQPAGEP